MVTPAETLAAPIRFTFSAREARNRFCKAATSERMSTWDPTDRSKCGIPTKELIHLLGRFGQGEPGLIVTGAINIDATHLEAAGSSIISADSQPTGERFDGFVKSARAAQAHGSLVLGQLNHTGRQTMASLQQHPVSASMVRVEENELGLQYNTPHTASPTEITELKAAFVHAAAYLEAAGFDGVQLNAAHGYLLSQFLAPRTNYRTDQYGGHLGNRARFLLEVIKALRNRCAASFVLSVKLNCFEYRPGAITLDEVKTLCAWLDDATVDMIELSAGTYEEFGWKHVEGYTNVHREGYYLDAADIIRPVLSRTRLYATGGFHTLAAMVDARKVVDGIGLARALCQEPDLPKRIIAGESQGRATQLIDPTDYTLTAMMAGSQMRQMAQSKQPMDGSKRDVVDEFLVSFGQWAEDMKNGKVVGENFRWMDVPYRTT